MVAACRDDRLCEPQLRKVPLAHDPCGGRGRSHVDGHGCGHVLERRQLDVEAVGDRIVAGLDEHVAPAKLVPLEAGQVDGDALTGVRALDGVVVHLHAPHADDAPATARRAARHPP